MASEIGRRIRSLLGSKDQSGLELVMGANAIAALAIVGVAWLALGLTAPWIAALVPTVFLLLSACLLSRYTVWIAACLGSLGLAVVPALLLAAALDHVQYGRWIGGTLGLVAGLAVGLWTYSRVRPAGRPGG